MRPSLSPFLLALLGLAPLALHAGGAPGAEDAQLDRALADLAAPSAEARRLAERWLGAHARPADFGALAEAAQAGDREVRRRLARALGSHDRHLDLAVLFACEQRPELRELGAGAVAELALAWRASLVDPPLAGAELRERLLELGDDLPMPLLRVVVQETLQVELDRMLRLGAAPIPIAFDSDVHPEARLREDPEGRGRLVLEGPWDELVALLVSIHGLELEGVAPAGDAQPGAPAWLRVCRRGSAGRETGLDQLVRWCREVASGGNAALRGGAARALAGSGWPAALGWLERRWSEQGDEAALDAVLLAAGRGRVAPVLLRADVHLGLAREVLARLDEPSGAARADRDLLVLRALGACGPLGRTGNPPDEGTVDLSAALVDGALAAAPAGLAWRLALWEAQASGAAEVRAAVAAVLAAPPGSWPPEVLVGALRAWVALPPTLVDVDGEPDGGAAAPTLGDPSGLLAWVEGDDDRRDLVELLARAAPAPPAAWSEPAPAREGAPGAPALEERPGPAFERGLLLVEWWLARGDVERAVHHLEALGLFAGGWPPPPTWEALDGDALRARIAAGDVYLRQGRAAAALADWIALGEGERVRALVDAARARRADDDARLLVDRLALLTGLPPLERRPGLEAFVLARTGEEDGAALGALGALPRGADARGLLLEALGRALEEGLAGLRGFELLRGVETAYGGLAARGSDDQAARLLARAASLLREHAGHELALHVQRRPWPQGPRNRPIDLERLDPAPWARP